jgi:hypothetical protein
MEIVLTALDLRHAHVVLLQTTEDLLGDHVTEAFRFCFARAGPQRTLVLLPDVDFYGARAGSFFFVGGAPAAASQATALLGVGGTHDHIFVWQSWNKAQAETRERAKGSFLVLEERSQRHRQ